MEMDLSFLNPQQREAIEHIDGPLLVLAGAGTGKTSVITYRIVNMLESGIKPENILAVTFTNKASREMKERVGHLLKKRISKGLIVGTFHNLGLNIIRQEQKTLGFKPGFSIFYNSDSISLIKTLILKDNAVDDEQVKQFQMLISQWKNNLQSQPRNRVQRL